VEIASGAPGTELFEKEDWPGLTEAIARWIENGCASVTGAAAIMSERYRPESYVRQHLEVYREVLRR
jgi:hypothetical protein